MIAKETLDVLESHCRSYPMDGVTCDPKDVLQLITTARDLDIKTRELKTTKQQLADCVARRMADAHVDLIQFDNTCNQRDAAKAELESVKAELMELRNTPIIGKPKMHRFPKHYSMIYEVEFKMKRFLDAAIIGEAFDAAKENSTSQS